MSITISSQNYTSIETEIKNEYIMDNRINIIFVR